MIAFLTYQYVSEKPEGIPSAWPAQVITNASSAPNSDWQLMSEENYAAYLATHQSDFDSWNAAVSAASPSMCAGRSICRAMDFGHKLIVEYGAKNVLRGYTIAQVRTVATKLNEVQSLLLSGSLYCAKQAITEMEVDSLVTQEDKDEFLSKINEYLGL